MLTLTCSRVFPDGRNLVATMRASLARCKYPITYTGAVDRVGTMPRSATPATLELLFATAIHQGEIGGGVNAIGEFDCGSNYVADDRLMEVQRNRQRYLKR